MKKCQLGCGRVDEEIGPHACGSFATCSGLATDVIPGRDVILTNEETGQVRVMDPFMAIQGKVPTAFSALDVSRDDRVTARVLGAESVQEAPVFVPTATLREPPKAETAAEKKARLKAEAKAAAEAATPAVTEGEATGGDASGN